MINWGLKRGFTLVELLVVVVILAVLSGAAYIGIQRAQVRVMNEKVADDLVAISNALEQFKQDEGHYPNIEDGELVLGDIYNVNCFGSDTTYSHDCSDATKTAFIQTQVDNNLLTKRYLQEVPTEPRTKSRYVYGVTTDGQFYQVAGNYFDSENDQWIARTEGNVENGYRLPSLIRSFNGRNFVMDGETYLPYSPDHLSLTATLSEISGSVKVNGDPADEDTVVQPDSVIEVEPGGQVAIYFSDGSMTYLDGTDDPNGAELRILPETEVEQNDEDGIITKIRLKLFSGKIWSKVARLAKESEFNVETTSAIAGVRGTEFGIDAIGNFFAILSGSVAIRQKSLEETDLSTGEETYIHPEDFEFENAQVATGNGSDIQTFYPPYAEIDSAPVSGVKIEGQDKEELLGKYYKGAFNNNYRPRILEVDTSTDGEERVVFEYLSDVQTITAIDAESHNVIRGLWFENGTGEQAIKKDPGETTLTIDPNQMALYANGGLMVQFQFTDVHGNKTGLTEPAVFVAPDLILAKEDIYNMGTEAVEVAQGLHIINPPASVELSTQHFIEATGPCLWSLTGGGVLTDLGPSNNTIYKTLDSLQLPAWQRDDVVNRFNGTDSESIKITCTDPNNVEPPDEGIITVQYAFKDVSGPNRYSYTSGVAKWANANAACANSTEGGKNWVLPKKSQLDIIGPPADTTPVSERMLLCPYTGGHCDPAYFQAESAFWLADLGGPNAYLTVILFNGDLSSEDQENLQNAYRCVEG